jgi:D-alanyl-lipoteichoic acid acyltransferase DltB (MBOAT superfamily)
MLFNSISFALFLPVVFILYWFVTAKSLKWQNILLLVSSYFFYACWDYRFLFLLVFSTILDFYTGIKISESDKIRNKKFWFWTSICINLGFLGVLKYYNFFASTFADVITTLGFKCDVTTLNVILPIGISFYTFHGLSYVIDIYKDKIKPTKNFIDYSVFVSFFPLLVAGPIERATHLLPQIQAKRNFDYTKAVDGLRQILWGLFKKVVIADNCAEYADLIFNNSTSYSGSTLVLGAVFFAFQIYGDFSGYSDIALGTARLFGIELLKNFSFPYFSRDIAEFWRRWHISLSSWFKDYLYIPLGGSKGGTWLKIRNTFIIFLVSGFWHGANWTFIAWGGLHALFFLPLLLFNKNRNHIDSVAKGKMLPSLKEFSSMLLTFLLVVLAWVFFRADTVHQAVNYISHIFTSALFKIPEIRPSLVIMVLALFIFMEWLGREKNYAIENFAVNLAKPLKWALHLFLFTVIILCMGKEQPFIYFQF